MPFNQALVQHVNVHATYECKVTSSIPPIRKMLNHVEQKTKRVLKRGVDGIGREVGTVAKYQQHAGIMHYRAIFTHRLWNSIQNKKIMSGELTAKYDVATTIYDQYPYTLIKGRKRVKPVRKKALRFKLTPGGDYRFATFTKRAKPKNYVKYSDQRTKPMIRGMVGRYINGLFG